MGDVPGEREWEATRRDPALAFETWRELFDAVPEAVFILDREGRFLALNRAVTQIYGYPHDELIGHSPDKLASPERVDIDAVSERFRAAFAGERCTIAWWGRRRDQSEFPMEISLAAGRFFGEPVVVAIAHDLSTHVEREMALAASEARYRAIFEQASDALLIVDPAEGEVRGGNRRAAELFGSTREKLRGHMIASLLTYSDQRGQADNDEAKARAEALRVALERAGEGELTKLSRWCLGGAGGELRWVDVAFSPFPEGEDTHLLVSIHDYTEAKRSSEALRALEERERVAERLRALGELAAGVAHNFNNSLTSILAHAQMLVRNDELPEAVREDLMIIERVARGAAVTVRRIQSFARSRDPEALEAADLGDVVANAVALTRPRWEPPGGVGKWQLEWEPHDDPLPIVGNAAELCEVVVNLILNALDAMPEGGRLLVETGAEDDRVWVEVADAGVGIDAASQQRLFDPFFSTKGRQGLGLGLSVSHGIIRRHGGEISLVSEPGKGSAFTIWLPRNEHTNQARGGAFASARPAKILLVDDDPVVRRSVSQMLEELGHTVVTAQEGREGLIRLDEHTDVELLISDLAMPGLDGAGLLREASRRWPDLPRVLVTGLVADADAGLTKVAHAVLSKPLELSELDRTLARLLPVGPLG